MVNEIKACCPVWLIEYRHILQNNFMYEQGNKDTMPGVANRICILLNDVIYVQGNKGMFVRIKFTLGY